MIDAHTHAWGPATDAHPWETASMVEEARNLPVADVYSAERLLEDLDGAGVDEAVVIGYPVYEWHDNAYTIEAVETHERLFGIGLIDPFEDGVEDRLRDLMAVERMLGFRLAVVFPRDRMYEVDPSTSPAGVDWLRDAIDRTGFWETVGETGATVNLLIHYDQLDQALALVEAYPELTYVVDHLARADFSKAPEAYAFARFAELATYDNVLVKVSAVPYLSEKSYPYEDVRPYLRWILEQFGRERVAIGSDYPFVSPAVDTYKECLTWIDHVDWLTTTDRRWVTERSFKRHLGVD